MLYNTYVGQRIAIKDEDAIRHVLELELEDVAHQHLPQDVHCNAASALMGLRRYIAVVLSP